MKKRYLYAIALSVICWIAGVAYAADVQVKLDSNDGTSSLVVQDSGAVQVWNVDSDGNATAKSQKLSGATSGVVTLQPAAVAGTWALTLPTSGGTDGYVLKTDGSGTTSWISPGSVAASWSSLTAPSANLALAMAGYTSTFTYGATTGAGTNLFSLTDTASNTGTGYLLDLTTASGSVLNPLHVSAAGTEALTVTKDARVGIGTNAPGSALDVKGTLRLSGATSGYVGIAPAAAAGTTTYTLPSADGTNGQALTTNGTGTLSWASPSGTGANTTLSNLTDTIAINKALIPGTAGVLDFGSTTKPWADIYLAGTSGTPGTNQFKITGASTSGVRTITLPDTSGTVTVLGNTTTGSGSIVLATSPTIATPTVTTSATAPLIIGGTATTSTLSLRSTSGAGDTGADIIFQTGTNGGTEAMRILNSGYVGIGIATPDRPLVVQSDDIIPIKIRGAAPTLFLSDSGVVDQQWHMRNYDGKLQFATNNDAGSSASVKITVDQSGNLGIGETAPGSKLAVSGGASVGASYDTTAAPTNGLIVEGNVGIGTNAPGSALDVKGTLRLSGATSGYVGIAPAAAAGTTTYTLPSADGTNGQALTTNGTGTLSWASGSSGDVTAAASLTDNAIVRGDGGSKGVQTSGITIDDSGNITMTAGTDIRPTANSTTALNIAQADGTDFVTFDTTNKRIGVVSSAGSNIAARFDVSNTEGVGFGSSLMLENTDTTVNNTTGVCGYNSNGVAVAGIEFVNANHGAAGTRQGALSLFTVDTGDVASYFRMTKEGNIGIKSTAPDRALEINSATGINLRLTYDDSDGSATNYADFLISSGGDLTISPSGDNTTIQNDTDSTTGVQIFDTDGGTPIVNIDTTNERVGIGTNAPGSALDVKGTLRLSGATSGYVGLAPAAAAGTTTYTLPSADGTNGQVLTTNSTGTLSWATPAGTGANVVLSNLTDGSVAINTSLVSDTDSTDDLGSTTKQWANLYTDNVKCSTVTDLTVENDGLDKDIIFKVNDGGTDTTLMILDASTSTVGIGTTGNGAVLGVSTDNLADPNNYGKAIQTVRPAIAGQHIAMVRNVNMVWSLGYVYNTNHFAIGTGLATDSDFWGNNIALAIDETTYNVGLGDTDPTSAKLVVVGGVAIGADAANNVFDDASTGDGSTTMYIGTNTITTAGPSDGRVKEDIRDTGYGIEDLDKIKVKDFKYRKEFIDDGGQTHTGMIAQELEPIYPEAVYIRSDGFKAINYEKLVPLLIKANQDLTRRVEALEAKGAVR